MAVLDPFVNELRLARQSESAQVDAAIGFHDAKTLRLGALRDAVLPSLAQNDQARQLFELSIIPGISPRLWVDLVSSVVMEPDPKHYRLVQDRDNGRVTLFETESLDDMKLFLTRFLAHRMIEQEREKASARAAARAARNKYASIDLILVWLAGLGLGILAAIGWVIGFGKSGS
jgi:hypothetical protein